ncbi:MAG: hypothetical protein DMF49_00710 [Acidobacteria bacterium]|nr:MAG: hypothetical protein DMF49_00710 [Acidobacteriota bacterium]
MSCRALRRGRSSPSSPRDCRCSSTEPPQSVSEFPFQSGSSPGRRRSTLSHEGAPAQQEPRGADRPPLCSRPRDRLRHRLLLPGADGPRRGAAGAERTRWPACGDDRLQRRASPAGPRFEGARHAAGRGEPRPRSGRRGDPRRGGSEAGEGVRASRPGPSLRQGSRRIGDRPRGRLQLQIASAGVGLLLLCTAIGLGLVKIIGGPLRDLVAATRRVAAGDLSVRVSPSSADEIGELGEAFNRMAADLEIARAEVLAERAELERRVASRTAELERAQETLVHSEKMSALGQLIAGVAHELNNPLTVVLGYVGLILEQTKDPDLRRKLELMSGEAERSRKLVRNLLAFARKQKPERAEIQVNEVVATTVGLREYPSGEDISLETDLEGDLPPILGDFHQLQQVLLNLLVNAEQAIKDSRKGRRIKVSTRLREGKIQIAVEDDGPGIRAANRGRIFEPFFTTKEVGRGTGLGLSICYGIIAEHAGAIEVDSEEGRFTRFTITLPVLDRPAAESRPPKEAAKEDAALAAEGTQRKVLVIDDDPSILCFVAEALSDGSITIETALGGREAIRRLSSGCAYDAILSDMRMPGVDGRAVFSFVREHRPELEERLIFSTGDVANPESLDFIEVSGRPVLSKPYSIAALRETVQRVVAGGAD